MYLWFYLLFENEKLQVYLPLITLKTSVYFKPTGTLAQRLECSPMARETWVQSQVESYLTIGQTGLLFGKIPLDMPGNVSEIVSTSIMWPRAELQVHFLYLNLKNLSYLKHTTTLICCALHSFKLKSIREQVSHTLMLHGKKTQWLCPCNSMDAPCGCW